MHFLKYLWGLQKEVLVTELELNFPKLALGTHETPWDLNVLLYKGFSRLPRRQSIKLIYKKKLKESEKIRSPLVLAFHEAITSMINKGKSRASIISSLETLWRFYTWADEKNINLTSEHIIDVLKDWAEHQIHRARIKKNISEMHAYRQVTRISNLIAGALRLPGAKPGTYLLFQTRMRKPSTKKSVLGAKEDKQNLEQTFKFGNALKLICDCLDINTVRGPLPILIEIDSNQTLLVAGNLIDPYMDVKSIKDSTLRRYAERARAPIKDNESLFDTYKRTGVLNIRIEAELLIFIAQTGMNLTQATSILREDYRWKSDGDDLEVFRLYKGRRNGEAIFRCFKSYKEHLQEYLKWLDQLGFSKDDTRLFPFQYRTAIPAKGSKIRLYKVKNLFNQVGIKFFGPQDLRKTRVNWLLRRSHDLDLTAEQMAHDKKVLLHDYERPHHQAASVEILSFHKATDPTILAPGPGLCTDRDHRPIPITGIVDAAPQPDCISPEGCLFCSKHRDVMSADYCWKLASHAQIKTLETDLYKPSINNQTHPAYYTIERINQKLKAISTGSKVREAWVKDAQDAVRSERYHPHWIGFIELLEEIK